MIFNTFTFFSKQLNDQINQREVITLFSIRHLNKLIEDSYNFESLNVSNNN